MAHQDRSRSPRAREHDEKRANDCHEKDLDLLDGFSAEQIFNSGKNQSGFTYDDLICLPGHINFGVHDVSLGSRFSRKISLKTPIVSSPMDTVTESSMAIAMALEGGIGVIHTNLPTEVQAKEVMKVKKYKSGFISDPVCVPPTMSIADLDQLKRKLGFTGFPVTESGEIGSKLIGLVTKRDTDFVKDRSVKLASIMTPRKDLVTAEDGIELMAANEMLQSSKKGKLPIVSKGDVLVSLVARTDLKKNAEFPLATKDKNKNLVVAASVGTRPADRDRVRALVAAGVDAIVVDSSQGDSMYQHDMIKWMKREFADLQVIG